MKMSRTLLFVGLAVAGSVVAQDPVFDDFERQHLGPNWTRYGNPLSEIIAWSDLGVLNTQSCGVGWTASVFAADQWSETTTAVAIDPNMLYQVFCRRRASDLARYAFHWNGDPGMSQWEIKYDGVPTALTRIVASVNGPGPAPGDVIRIEVEGTNPVLLRGYHNGQIKLVAPDAHPSRIITTGPAGVVARMKQGTVNVPPTPIFESWSGGSLQRPRITALSPSIIPLMSPTSSPVAVTATGVRFLPGCAVSANGVSIATTVLGPTQLSFVLGPDVLQTQRAGGIAINATNPGNQVSVAAALVVSGGSNQGTLRCQPLSPAPGQVFSLVLEEGLPGAAFSIYADLSNPMPWTSWPDSNANFVLAVDPLGGAGTFIPVVEGLGLFGPSSGATILVDGSFTLPGLVMPTPPLNLTATLQGVFLDPSAPYGFRLTWARWPLSF
jgi:hypothetical protein